MILPIYFNSPELRTLGDFLNDEGTSPAFSYKDKSQQFLEITDGSGKRNFDKILEATPQDLKQEQSNRYFSGQWNSLELFPPIVFSIDTKSIITDLFSIQGNLVQNAQNVNYFIAKELADLVLNPQFVLKSKSSKEKVKGTHPKLTVWLWSRSLSQSFGVEQIGLRSNFELINITPFIDNVNVTSTKEGSSFSVSIAPISGTLGNFPEGWKIKKESISFSKSNLNPEYRAISHIEDSNLESNGFFFHNIIQQNDLIFISFEELAIEKSNYRSELSIPFKAINEKIWDFIGLVDNNELGISKEGQNEVSINVSGRDLTKLIIEDGSYFWATEFGLNGTMQFAGNRDGRIAKRIEANGFNSYFSIANKSIEDSLRFIIGQLANTGLVPNYVFQNYGNRRSTIFTEEVVDRETVDESTGGSLNQSPEVRVRIKLKREPREVIADGVWGITKIIIDPQIANLRLVDSALFVEQGSFINYIKRICQEPFVEFYTETIGDQFFWIARRPPHNKDAILGAKNGISIGAKREIHEGFFSDKSQPFVFDIEQIDVIRLNLRFDERAYSWFKFEPRYAFGGSQDNIVSLALLPAVFLPTYTNLFGSRPLNVSSNYVNYIPSNGEDDKDNYLNAIEQAYYDLAWLIETHAYLPFTRTGSIVINEDRRIKKGMHIRLKQTREIFLVTSVSHTMSISKGAIVRQTTLQVERGMIEDYIKGKEVQGFDAKDAEGKRNVVSYFNLVKTPINLKRLRNSGQLGGERFQPITQWAENEQCINFFLQRRQFGK